MLVRKIGLVLFGLAVAIASIGAVSNANAQVPPATTVFIDPDFTKLHSDPGQISVSIADVQDLFAFEFDISFDPAVVSAVSVTEGSFFASTGNSFFIAGTIDNALGLISFTADTLIGPGPGLDGDGELAVLTFDPVGPQGTSAIALANVILLDPLGADIPFQTVDGTIAVPAPAAWPLLGLGLIALATARRRTTL